MTTTSSGLRGGSSAWPTPPIHSAQGGSGRRIGHFEPVFASNGDDAALFRHVKDLSRSMGEAPRQYRGGGGGGASDDQQADLAPPPGLSDPVCMTGEGTDRLRGGGDGGDDGADGGGGRCSPRPPSDGRHTPPGPPPAESLSEGHDNHALASESLVDGGTARATSGGGAWSVFECVVGRAHPLSLMRRRYRLAPRPR